MATKTVVARDNEKKRKSNSSKKKQHYSYATKEMMKVLRMHPEDSLI